MLRVTVLWAKRLPSWGVQLHHSLVERASKLGLLVVYTSSWRGGKGHQSLTWVCSHSLPSVVFESALIPCALDEEWEYIHWGRPEEDLHPFGCGKVLISAEWKLFRSSLLWGEASIPLQVTPYPCSVNSLVPQNEPGQNPAFCGCWNLRKRGRCLPLVKNFRIPYTALLFMWTFIYTLFLHLSRVQSVSLHHGHQAVK